jgi:hypothetical protein
MEAPGIEPGTATSNTNDLQQSIALNRENASEDIQGIEALARQLAGLSDDQRAVLAALLANEPSQTEDTSLHAVISPKLNRNSCDVE